MLSRSLHKGVFVVAAWYDLILGAVFLLFYGPVYSALSIPLPESTAYLHLAAAFVVVQGIGYLFVAGNMDRNVDIVKMGVVYKAAYAAVSLIHWQQGTLPHGMFALFGLLDLVFLVFFVLFLMGVRAAKQTA
jgi:hypothetical protein